MKGYRETTYLVITVLITSRPFLAVEVYQFTTSPASDIVEGQSITLVCKYNRSVSTSTEPATTTWYRYKDGKNERIASFQNGFSIIEDGYTEKFKVEQNGNLVIIITRHDAGMYKCEVVIYDDIPKRSTETLNITVYYADKPTIYIIPSQVMVGDNVKIICDNNDANPEPLLQIYNGHFQESSNRNSHNYTKTTTKDDSGDYYCVARNKAGNKTSDSKKLTIYFIEIPVLVILNDAKDNSYTIVCRCPDSVPVPHLYIYHNNVMIKNTTGLNLTHRLEKVTKENEGDYKCVAENLAGKRNSNTRTPNIDSIDSTISTTVAYKGNKDFLTNNRQKKNKSLGIYIGGAIAVVLVLVIVLVLSVCKCNLRKTSKNSKFAVLSLEDCYSKESVEVPTSQNNGRLDTTIRHETNDTAVIRYEKNPNPVSSRSQTLRRNTEDLVYADLDFQNCTGKSAKIKRVVENTIYSSVVHYDAQ